MEATSAVSLELTTRMNLRKWGTRAKLSILYIVHKSLHSLGSAKLRALTTCPVFKDSSDYGYGDFILKRLNKEVCSAKFKECEKQPSSIHRESLALDMSWIVSEKCYIIQLMRHVIYCSVFHKFMHNSFRDILIFTVCNLYVWTGIFSLITVR